MKPHQFYHVAKWQCGLRKKVKVHGITEHMTKWSNLTIKECCITTQDSRAAAQKGGGGDKNRGMAYVMGRE